MNRGQGSFSTDSRQSSPCLRQARRQALDRQGRSTRSGLLCLNNTSPHPMGCKSGPSADQNAFGRNRYNRGASQQQQPHKSNSSGRVKPLTPLLARKKRMPSLTSSPVFGSYRVWSSRIKSYTKLCHKGRALIINHKTLLFNRSLDHLPLRHATQAIHSMRLISINI